MEFDVDGSKFECLDELIHKGHLTATEDVGGVKVGYRTLTHEEELQAATRANGNMLAFRVEQLAVAITTLNGKKISNDFKEREVLRVKLGKLPSTYINAYFAPYAMLLSKIPPITKESIENVLGEDQAQEHSTKSSYTVESFQQTQQ